MKALLMTSAKSNFPLIKSISALKTGLTQRFLLKKILPLIVWVNLKFSILFPKYALKELKLRKIKSFRGLKKENPWLKEEFNKYQEHSTMFW